MQGISAFQGVLVESAISLQPRINPAHGIVKGIGSGLIETRKQVPVGVQGGSDRSMAHPRLDYRRMKSLSNEKSRRVPQIVKRA